MKVTRDAVGRRVRGSGAIWDVYLALNSPQIMVILGEGEETP